MPTEYCYRYLPWPDQNRPDDVRQFFPCDFNPRLNISLRISGMVAVGGINTGGQVIKQSLTKEARPEDGNEANNQDGNAEDPY
jgi:hypothetical protein